MRKPLIFEVYRSKKEFRWRLKSGNNRIIADSAESYKRKATLLKLIDSFHHHSFVVEDRTL